MNYLKTIQATGLKSGAFTHDLTRVNLITGPSFSGKTSILDAVRLALNGGTLLGRAGELKVTTSAIMDLACGSRVEILATDDAGRVNNKTWQKGKPAFVSAEIPQCPDVLMDPAKYIELSAAGKIEYAFSLYTMDGEFTGAAICAAIKNIRLEENTAETEAILTELFTIADKSDVERHHRDESIQVWIGELIARFTERLKLAKATAVRMSKTVQGITQLAGDQVQAINPAAELADEREKLAPIQAEIAKLQASLDLLETLKRRRAVVSANLDLTNEAAGQLTTYEASLATIQQTVETLEGQSVTWAGQEELPGHVAELEKLNAELAGWNQAAFTKTFTAFSEAVHAFDSEANRNHDLRNKLQGFMFGTPQEIEMACPHCGSAPEHWTGRNSVASIKAQAAKEIESLNAQIAESDAKILELTSARDKTQAAKMDAMQNSESMAFKRDRARTLQTAVNEINRAQTEATGAHNKRLATARTSLRDTKAAHDALTTKLANRPQLVGQLAELDGQIAGIDAQPINANLTAQRMVLEATKGIITALEAKQRNYQAAQADEQRNAQALLEHAKAQADVDCTNAAVDVLEEIQRKMIKAAFVPIMTVVNQVTAGVIPEPIEYIDGEIGRYVAGRWVKHETFSGTEKALVYAGISLALAKDSPIKIVMIDELGRMDTGAIRTVLETMVRLAEAGTIDQFIGCYSGDFPEVAGVNIIAVK